MYYRSVYLVLFFISDLFLLLPSINLFTTQGKYKYLFNPTQYEKFIWPNLLNNWPNCGWNKWKPLSIYILSLTNFFNVHKLNLKDGPVWLHSQNHYGLTRLVSKPVVLYNNTWKMNVFNFSWCCSSVGTMIDKLFYFKSTFFHVIFFTLLAAIFTKSINWQ